MEPQNVAKESPHLIDEADVASGERTPGQRETDAIVEQIGTPLPENGRPAAPPPVKPDSGATDERAVSDSPQDNPPGVLPRAGAT